MAVDRVNCPCCAPRLEREYPCLKLPNNRGTVCILCGTAQNALAVFGDRTCTVDVASAFRFEGFEAVLQLPIDELTVARVKMWIANNTKLKPSGYRLHVV
jgi:hypothetical protein